jgi:transposase-like protein
MLVRTGSHAYVEVYISGTIVPVRNDGSVVA